MHPPKPTIRPFSVHAGGRALLLFGGLLLGCAALAAPTDKPPSQQELSRVREQIKEVNKALEKDRERHDKLGRQLHETEQGISRLADTLRRLGPQIAGQEKAVARAREQRDAAAARMEAERETLRRQVRAAYLMGRQQQTKLLLNQEDPARLGRVLTYYDYLNRARTRQIRTIEQQVTEFRAAEERLQASLDELLRLRESRQVALQRLKTTRDARQATLSGLSSSIESRKGQLNRLKQSEERLTQLLSSVQQTLADSAPLDLAGNKPFPQLKGRLPWPVRGRLLASYGQPKAGGRLSWRGIWISAPAGTPVQAVARGRVVYVGFLHLYGLIVVVEHGNNYFSLYGHCQNATVTVGQTLQAGQALAQAGDSGGHAQTGVYFEIRNGKNPQNPSQWLRR